MTAKEHARASDPWTSHEAAESAEELIARHCGIIFDVLKRVGPLTSQQISDNCELDHPQVWRRVSDLKNQKLVVESDLPKRFNRSGRRAIVWEIAGDQQRGTL